MLLIHEIEKLHLEYDMLVACGELEKYEPWLEREILATREALAESENDGALWKYLASANYALWKESHLQFEELAGMLSVVRACVIRKDFGAIARLLETPPRKQGGV